MNDASGQLVAYGPDADVKDKVLIGVAQELEDLSAKNKALQTLITPLLNSNLLDTSLMIEVQSVDVLAQHLAELAKFLANFVQLNEEGNSNSVSSALNGIVLSALAERLSAVCLGLKTAQTSQAPVEFF